MFTKASEDEAMQKRQDIQDGIDRRLKSELEKIKQEALENAEKKLELELYRLKQAQKREIANYKSEARKKIILKRAELLEALTQSVKKALAEYMSTDEYKERLSESISRDLREYPEMAAVLRPADYECLELMGTTASNQVTLGGYRLVHEALAIDNTFETRLTQQMEDFRGFDFMLEKH